MYKNELNKFVINLKKQEEVVIKDIRKILGNNQTINKELSESSKVLILKALLFGYAEIVAEQTEDKNRNEFWYKQSVDVRNYFKKAKPAPVQKLERELLDKVYKSFVNFDAEYFGTREGSPYLCMITILIYLIDEKNDLSMRVKFGHYPFKQIAEELQAHPKLKSLYFDSNKYMSAILDKLNVKEIVYIETIKDKKAKYEVR